MTVILSYATWSLPTSFILLRFIKDSSYRTKIEVNLNQLNLNLASLALVHLKRTAGTTSADNKEKHIFNSY